MCSYSSEMWLVKKHMHVELELKMEPTGYIKQAKQATGGRSFVQLSVASLFKGVILY